MSFSDDLRVAYAEQPFLLAPMAGVTDAAYRIMCRRRGARHAYSEMVSVAGLAYASNKTWRLVLPEDEEPQICVQLFGSKPEQFSGAVAAVEERVGEKLTLIDINMACPARKVITKGEGCALMETPELAEEMTKAAIGDGKDEDRTEVLYTYCASCVSRFQRKGIGGAVHVLPLILGVREEMPKGIHPFLNRALWLRI